MNDIEVGIVKPLAHVGVSFNCSTKAFCEVKLSIYELCDKFQLDASKYINEEVNFDHNSLTILNHSEENKLIDAMVDKYGIDPALLAGGKDLVFYI